MPAHGAQGAHPTPPSLPLPTPWTPAGYGFERPSEIQQHAVVPIIRGQDTIIQCAPGAGATTAMVLGLLQRVDINIVGCQALVLCCTGESAGMVHASIRALSEFTQVRAAPLTRARACAAPW